MYIKDKKRIIYSGIFVIIIEAILYLLDRCFGIETLIVNLDLYILLAYFLYALFLIVVFDIRKLYRIGIYFCIAFILVILYIRSHTDYYKFISPNKETVIVSEYGDISTVWSDIYIKKNFLFKKRISTGNIFIETTGSAFTKDCFKIEWKDDLFIIECWTGKFIDNEGVWKRYSFKIK
ncbi:MAG: hypothetical protein E7212_07040 [Clostridium sartagoforme]|nr:hypothetical protein [Clostridium sartagoforme]